MVHLKKKKGFFLSVLSKETFRDFLGLVLMLQNFFILIPCLQGACILGCLSRV